MSNISNEVYKHFGLDLMKMLDEGIEHDWGICKRELASKLTNDFAKMGVDEKGQQRIIIDYDENYEWCLVRRIPMDYGASKKNAP